MSPRAPAPELAAYWEAQLEKDGLGIRVRLPQDPKAKNSCPVCGRRARKATRQDKAVGITTTWYCYDHSRATDQIPVFTETLPTAGRLTQARGENFFYRQETNSQAHSRATALLHSGTLTTEQYEVWDLFCQGFSERRIAIELNRGRLSMYNNVLRPLLLLCGLPVRKAS